MQISSNPFADRRCESYGSRQNLATVFCWRTERKLRFRAVVFSNRAYIFSKSACGLSSAAWNWCVSISKEVPRSVLDYCPIRVIDFREITLHPRFGLRVIRFIQLPTHSSVSDTACCTTGS